MFFLHVIQRERGNFQFQNFSSFASKWLIDISFLKRSTHNFEEITLRKGAKIISNSILFQSFPIKIFMRKFSRINPRQMYKINRSFYANLWVIFQRLNPPELYIMNLNRLNLSIFNEAWQQVPIRNSLEGFVTENLWGWIGNRRLGIENSNYRSKVPPDSNNGYKQDLCKK